MRIETAHFGEMLVDTDDVILFPSGLMGMEQCQRWVLLSDRQSKNMAWLQSIDASELALAVVSPRRFIAGFQARVGRRDLEALGMGSLDGAELLTIVGGEGDELWLNAKAPIVVDTRRRVARQVINLADVPLRWSLDSAVSRLRSVA